MAEPYKPKDPAIAAAVASMVLTLQQMGMFDRIGISDSDVLFYSLLAVLVLTGARATWYKFWPESANRFWGGKPKANPAPSELPDDPTSPEGLPRGLARVDMLAWVVGASLCSVVFLVSPLASAVVALAFAVLLAAFTARRWLRYFALPALALALTGCAGLSGPGLQSVVGRIDVTKAITCWKQPTPRDKAKCLGVEVLSQGIDIALGEAARWGEKALKAASGTGADDLSERDIREIASETDAAMAKLGAEIAAAQ